MQAVSTIRYFEQGKPKPREPETRKAFHFEFLRTGRISRKKEDWVAAERRYLTHDEVAARTGRRLQIAGEQAHERINSAHRAIQLPKLIFHRTLKNTPHLGYCHVTAARTSFARKPNVRWAFYIANFSSEISNDDEHFFENIAPNYARMYFAVAMTPDDSGERLEIDRSLRPNGLLFRTSNPDEAIRNVLMLGAQNGMLREIARRL